MKGQVSHMDKQKAQEVLNALNTVQKGLPALMGTTPTDARNGLYNAQHFIDRAIFEITDAMAEIQVYYSRDLNTGKFTVR
jgi:hypothetical protein